MKKSLCIIMFIEGRSWKVCRGRDLIIVAEGQGRSHEAAYEAVSVIYEKLIKADRASLGRNRPGSS
jgi:hypothetical protein